MYLKKKPSHLYSNFGFINQFVLFFLLQLVHTLFEMVANESLSLFKTFNLPKEIGDIKVTSIKQIKGMF